MYTGIYIVATLLVLVITVPCLFCLQPIRQPQFSTKRSRCSSTEVCASLREGG